MRIKNTCFLSILKIVLVQYNIKRGGKKVPAGRQEKKAFTSPARYGTIILCHTAAQQKTEGRPAALIALGLLEGTGYTFNSGSDSALLYELLKRGRREGDYLRFNARLQAAQSVLTGATISIGAFLAAWSWAAVYGVTALCLGAAWLALVPIREPDLQSEPEPAGPLPASLRQKILYPSLPVFLLCVAGFGWVDGVSGSYYSYNQILFQRRGIPVALIGVFFSANSFAASAVYLLAGRLSGRVPKRRLILWMMALQGALYGVLAFARQPGLFMALSFICCLTPEVIYILADSIIQAHIASAYRATILSVVSMIRSLLSAAAYSILGGILDRTDVTGFMLFLALVTFGALGGFWLVLTCRGKRQR